MPNPPEKRSFVLPPDKRPQPAMEGRSVGSDGKPSDRAFHVSGMGTTDETEEEDLAAMRELIQKSGT